jgi:DNA excision repair protein ERCC-4
LTDLSCVVVDTREKNMEIYEFLDRNKINVVSDALDVGDIMVFGSQTFLIERKTESDFVSSLLDGRLFKQMRNLAETSDVNGYVPCLLFVGDKWKIWKFRNIKPIQVAGALNTIQFKFGIQIMEEKTESAAGLRILNLVQMYDPEKKIDKVYPIRTISKKNLTNAEYVRGILEGFPTIGPTMAKRWQEEFMTLDKCLKAINNGELIKLKGFGDKTLEAIKKIYK